MGQRRRQGGSENLQKLRERKIGSRGEVKRSISEKE
mgnify:CR=1 FL=1